MSTLTNAVVSTSDDIIYSTDAVTPMINPIVVPGYQEVAAMYINDNIESLSFTKFLSALNTETIKALLWKLNIELNQRNNT